MIIKPKIRGFICTTAHPTGCAAHVQQWIDYVQSKGPIGGGPEKVLVIGASTGYGLASRITAAFGCNASTVGIFFEKPGSDRKPGSAGYYNSAAFEEAANSAGLYAKSLNGDAFSNELKQQAVELIKRDLGQVDLVVYSLASPRRDDPRDGQTYRSVLKPIGQTYTNKTLDTDKAVVSPITIEPAAPEEIMGTVKVMGGEDWEMWMEALGKEGLLADGASTVAYSYIGPELTWPIYKEGTIGRAKDHLQATASRLNDRLEGSGGRAIISVNKALVTQASSAIPVVPLYISLLYKIMKEEGTHEGCIEQMVRLFAERLYTNGECPTDEEGRIRIDDLEMEPAVQSKVAERWEQITTENLTDLSDFAGYQAEFLSLFGFGLPGVDYDADIDPDVRVPSLG